MTDLLELATREGAGLLLALLLPLFAVAAGAAIVAGWLGSALGVRDGALGQCLRAIAVLVAIGVLGESLAATATAYARARWGSLADVHDASRSEP